MITLENLSKRYGNHLAVDNLSVEIQPGKVTGLLGPNGAGKSTTMRMILGLDRRPRARRWSGAAPMPPSRFRFGASAPCWIPRRCTRAAAPVNHLKAMARSNQIAPARVEEVLQEVVSGMVNKRVQLKVPEPDALMELGRRLAAESLQVWRRGSDRLLVEGASRDRAGGYRLRHGRPPVVGFVLMVVVSPPLRPPEPSVSRFHR